MPPPTRHSACNSAAVGKPNLSRSTPIMSDSNSSDSNTNPRTGQPKASHIDLDSSLISWNPAQRGGRPSAMDAAANRRKIRAQASRASATQRKATMATKGQRKPQQVPTPSSSASVTPGSGRQEALLQAQRLHAALNQPGIANSGGPRHVDFQEFVSVVDALESQQHWLSRALRETTMAQTSIRGDMRDAFTISPALFQATLFIAGTFSNTCGLSYADVRIGVGMAFMRGASLDAVRNAITSAEGSHWISMAVALLAGWELRFGDRESYDIHMTAYRKLFGAPLDLNEKSIAMMRDFAFESLREQLNDLVLSTPLRTSEPSRFWEIQPGFDVFSPVVIPEVKSLLSIIRDTAQFDPRPLGSLQFIRNQGLVSSSLFLAFLCFSSSSLRHTRYCADFRSSPYKESDSLDSTSRRDYRAISNIRRPMGSSRAQCIATRARCNTWHNRLALFYLSHHTQGNDLPRHHERRRSARPFLPSSEDRRSYWNEIPRSCDLGESVTRCNLARSIA